jgi:hypothetical protein
MTFRPFRRTPFQRALPDGALMGQLNDANRLLAQGQAAEAAPLFGQVAQAMEASGHPRRAANLHARAAHAFADAGREALALQHARLALRLFKQYAMAQRLQQFSANILRKFQAGGMAPAAEALQREYGLPASVAAPAAPAAALARLPGACLKCGAPVHSDDVEWIDPHSAECPYCGAVLRAE